MSTITPTPPLTLIIRFTTSLPDLPLTIPSPRNTTPTTLCALIRPHLPTPISHSPLRLIYAGALLPPTTSLQKCLRLSTNGKSPANLYIHCAISTETILSPTELDVEAASLLRNSNRDSYKNGHEQDVDAHDDNDDESTAHNSTSPAAESTIPPPLLGFDRLLTAGLSPAEVASLRSQFLAVQAHTHTPDTMPSGVEMRLLEERWLEAGTPLHGGGGGEDEEGAGGLEDMLWGNVMGFFWAVGAIVWLVREDGVWSKRRQVGVVTGVLVNVAFCMLRFGV